MEKLARNEKGRPDESTKSKKTLPSDVTVKDEEGQIPDDEQDAPSTAPSDVTAEDEEARPDA